ncbi:MAG: alpha/beta hydrolase [Rhizomicrobium sp.]
MTNLPSRTRTSRLTHGGDAIAVWDRPGDAMPFVFVHGNSCSREAFRPLFESAALARHRLVALDLPGCGESADAAAPQATYTLPGLADAVLAVTGALGVERHVLVGWSLGGHLGIEMMLHGATPDGIVLTGTPPCGPDPAEIAATFLPAEGAEVMSMEHPAPEQIAAFLKTVYAPAAPNAALVAATERADGRMRRRFFEYIFANPHLEPQRVTVANWQGPVALIQGRHEPFFEPAKLDELRWGNLWRGRTQWIDGAGHAPFFSHPDDYARVLTAFAGDLAAGG